MKKLMISGVLSLFVGGMAVAAISTSNMDFSANKSTLNLALVPDVPEVPEIIGSGIDEGGFYYILSDSHSCWKWHPSKSTGSDIPGMVD